MDELNISIDQLSETQQLVDSVIGLEQFECLIRAFGGTFVYVPKPDEFLRSTRNARIREEYDGGNIRALALQYGLTEMQIRNILASTIRELRAKPLDGQTDMFEYIDQASGN